MPSLNQSEFNLNFANPGDQPATARPNYDFAISGLSPGAQTLFRLKHSAQANLSLTNKSNCPALFQLTGQGETMGCHVEFELPTGFAGLASRVELELGPGESLPVLVRLTLPPPPLIALARRRYHFTVTTTLLAERWLSRSLTGRVETTPLIGSWLISLFVLCLLALAAFGVQSLPPFRPPLAAELAETNRLMTPTPTIDTIVRPTYLAGNSPSNLPEAERQDITEMTYQQMFKKVAAQYGLDWRILAEIAYQESRFNPWAIGRRNEIGLMQIRPSTWNEWAPQVGVFDPYDPYSNVQVAAAYLLYIKNYCRARGYTEEYWMLAGYNWGPNNLRQLFQQQGGWDQVPERPRQYALRIMRLGPESPARRYVQLRAIVIPLVETPK